ncbi:hypothetical protein THAOC_27594, partial [Thalassiosira oceanica]
MDQDSSDVLTLGVSDGLPPSQISDRRRKSSAVPDLGSTEKGIHVAGGGRRRVARHARGAGDGGLANIAFEAGQSATETDQPSTPKGTNSPTEQAEQSGKAYVASLPNAKDLDELNDTTAKLIRLAILAIETRKRATDQGKDENFKPKSFPTRPSITYDVRTGLKRNQRADPPESKSHAEEQVIVAFAEELPFLAELAVVQNGGDPDDHDKHQLVIETIGRFVLSTIKDTKLSAKEFIELYMKVHNLDACPSPFDSIGIHASVSSAIAEINVGRDASMTDDTVEVEETEANKDLIKKYAQTISYWVQG